MNLFICGNGLDIHIGLKSRYINYREFLEGRGENIVNRLKAFKYCNINEEDMTWNDLESNLKLDYEGYIKEYLDLFNRPRNKPGVRDSEEKLRKTSDFGLSDFTNNIYQFTGELFWQWLVYMYNKEKIQSIKGKYDHNTSDLSHLKNNKEDLFINFNYTRSLEDVFEIQDKQILHIHGSLEKRGVNITLDDIINADAKMWRKIQFGSIDNNQDDIEDYINGLNISANNNYFNVEELKYDLIGFCNKSYKDITYNYSKLKDFIKDKKVDKVIIMGHSMMGVDLKYYENIIMPILNDSIWEIYYYNDNKEAIKFINKFSIPKDKVRLIAW
ncbi:hypothetical protein LXJ15735_27960 [Lacrimispora xylanolytica]